MPTKNFMTAGTEIEGLIDKKAQILEKISNELADACVTRAKSAEINKNMIKDINNLINNLPVEDQRDILLLLSYKLATQITPDAGNFKSRSGSNSSKNRNDIFANRRF